jgi:hypothetical protein
MRSPDRSAHSADRRNHDDHQDRGPAGDQTGGGHGGGQGETGGEQDRPEPEPVEQVGGGRLDPDVPREHEQHDGTGLDRRPAEDVLEQQWQQERHRADRHVRQCPAGDRDTERGDPQGVQIDERIGSPE